MVDALRIRILNALKLYFQYDYRLVNLACHLVTCVGKKSVMLCSTVTLEYTVLRGSGMPDVNVKRLYALQEHERGRASVRADVVCTRLEPRGSKHLGCCIISCGHRVLGIVLASTRACAGARMAGAP